MRINANVMAINSHRQLGALNTAQGKATEKLSSGFRINRAADDAAGLAISEKMRSQIRGMNQAARNAQDGISVVQTAEGALDEVHSMLQRMKELAVQSANDSNQSVVDREALQLEVDQLTEEINSITKKTQFNKMTLLDGSFQDKKFHVGANADETIDVSIKSMTARGLGLKVGGEQVVSSFATGTRDINNKGFNKIGTAAQGFAEDDVVVTTTNLKVDSGLDAHNGKDAIYRVEYNGKFTDVKVKVANGKITDQQIRDAVLSGLNSLEADGFKGDGTADIQANKALSAESELIGANVKVSWMNNETFKVEPKAALVVKKNDAQNVAAQAATAEIAHDEKTYGSFEITINGGEAVTVNVTEEDKTADVLKKVNDAIKPKGASATFTNGVIKITTDATGTGATIDIKAAGAANRKTVEYKGVNILTREAANASMDNVQKAIEELASRRAELGAVQNRVEHTIKNLENSAENLTAAESRVRHTDMAKEMMEFTRTNILTQAAQAMLAQANQLPQGVLQLLR